MLTTIQENVIVGNDGVIQLHTYGFKLNSKLSIIAVVEESKEKITSTKPKSKNALGILNKYANPKLKHLEKTAFADAMEEKHAIN